MLNVPELREKLHAARHKDTEVAYVARKWMGKVLDELESLQKSMQSAMIDNEGRDKKFLIYESPPHFRDAAIEASMSLFGDDQFSENLMVAENMLASVTHYMESRDKLKTDTKAWLDLWHNIQDL